MLMRNLLTAGPEVLSPLWGWLHTRSTGYGGRPQSRTPTWGFGRDGTGYSACSANSSTGTKPAADTRFGSSNTADPTVNVCDDCTGNAFRTRDDYDLRNRYCPSSGGILAVHTPITKDQPSTDSGLAPPRPPCGEEYVLSIAELRRVFGDGLTGAARVVRVSRTG